MYKIGFARDVDESWCIDIITTAAESGCAYWFNDTDYVRNGKHDRNGEGGWTRIEFEFCENGDGKKWTRHVVDAGKIADAVQRILAGGLCNESIRGQFIEELRSPVDGCCVDADAADVAFQIAAFDKIIFG